jgi:hypothetical protein
MTAMSYGASAMQRDARDVHAASVILHMFDSVVKWRRENFLAEIVGEIVDEIMPNKTGHVE